MRNTYFKKFSERNISQCLLDLRTVSYFYIKLQTSLNLTFSHCKYKRFAAKEDLCKKVKETLFEFRFFNYKVFLYFIISKDFIENFAKSFSIPLKKFRI